MAVSGSTRMQASTALQLIIGLGLLTPADSGVEHTLEDWITYYENLDLNFLKGFITKEAETYQEGNRTIYSADEFAITVMTDTTERAPTFNLSPFDNQVMSQSEPSLTYVSISRASDFESSWRALLRRPPRSLNWPEYSMKATLQYLAGFDFGQKVPAFRKKIAPKSEHRIFEIFRSGRDLAWKFQGIEKRIPLLGGHELFHHLTLKMEMNIHSTLLMGRLGRYEGNVMTWVYPSNGKLIDRTSRYAIAILERQGLKNIDYDEIVRTVFSLKRAFGSKESYVLKTAEAYRTKHG
jgi:N-acetylmuramic acid 6-phosphate etherase